MEAQQQNLNTESVEPMPDSTEDAPRFTRAAHLQALADKDAIEIAIRHEADRGELYSRGTIDTAGLIGTTHRDCTGVPEKKKSKMRMEKKDLRNEINGDKERLCLIIRGQNKAMRSSDEKETETDPELENLRGQIDHQEREIRDLKIVSQKDMEVLRHNNNLLSETRTALSKAERETKKHQREIKGWESCGEAWKKANETKHGENTALRSELRKLKQDQITELLLAQADNESLQIWNKHLKEANDKMDEELEYRQHGHRGSLRVSQTEQTDRHSRDDVWRSLAEALKGANARANTLQIGVNALQAENGALKRQLGDLEHSCDPKIQEQMDRLQNENHILREAQKTAAATRIDVIALLAKAEEELEERFVDRTRKLEAEFAQGFEDLRKLRDQWLLHKRNLEEQHNRGIVAENLRREIEYRGQQDHLATARKELQDKEEGLQNRETELANQASNHASSSQNLFEMTTRAEQAEKDGIDLPAAAQSDSARRNLIERNLNNEVRNQRRAAQRHLDLLNEETSKMPEWSRIIDLHNELQQANCSMNNFIRKVTENETESEVLSQTLFGADFNDYDVSLLQGEGRPGLLGQLRGAKQTLNTLRRHLAQSPNVDVDRALSIVMALRGDEGMAQPADDIFDQWDGNGQSASQPNSRKRSGAHLGGPTYRGDEDNAASNDWGDQDQEVSSGARLSTPEEVETRQRILPKSRRNGGPANTVPLESIDPAIRDQ